MSSAPSLMIRNRFRYWPGDSVPPAVWGSTPPIATRSVIRTRIGPRRQVSSVTSRLVAPW